MISLNFDLDIFPGVKTDLSVTNKCFYSLNILINTESVKMAGLSTIHMNDAGVLFVVTINDDTGPVDLSSAQNVSLIFGRPDRSTLTVPCVITGTIGVVNYTSQPSDFNQFGRWRIQAVVKFSDTDLKHSNIGTINVLQNLI